MSGTKYIASNWRVPENSNSSKNDNYSLDFGGTSYIDLGTSIDLGTNSTISFWFKSSTGNTNHTLIGEDTYSFDYLLQLASGTNTSFVRIGSVVKSFTTTELNDGNWNHWCIVRSGDSVELFINNSSKGIQTGYGTGTNTLFNVIGAEGDYDFPINGDISDFAAFNYTLDTEQISKLRGDSALGAGNPMALKPTPVAYYPLGDNSSGDPVTQPNVSVDDASVFDFNGSSEFFTIPTSSSLEITGDMSISAWIYIPSSFSANGTVIGKRNGSNTNYQFFINTIPKMQFYDGVSNLQSNTILTKDVWHHVAITIESGVTNGSTFYLNGTPDGTQTFTITEPGTVPDLYIGLEPAFSSYYEGMISNAAIFNSTLSGPDITAIYNNGQPADL
ncbi:MAG: LamG domain-containing protein, partial [Saprospiraceae bacterium]